jgi:VWFA-related protein
MRSRFSAFWWCLCCCYLTVVWAQDPYSLKVDATVVSVDVTVVDSKGNLVNDLDKDDFSLYENGILQPIRFFSPVSAPYNVFLLFDSSGSTIDNRDFMQNAVAGLLENLRPQDSIAMASFDDDFKLALSWSTDRIKAGSALRQIMRPRPSYETRFYSSLDRTLRREFKGVVGRRAIVVLTDGQDTRLLYGANGDLRKVLTSSRDARIPIYIVGLDVERPAPSFLAPNTANFLKAVHLNMKRFAENSGGQLLVPKTFDDVTGLYKQIGRTLGTAYSIGYVPPQAVDDGAFHRIEVKPRDTNLRLKQSRSGYYAEPVIAVRK